MPDLDIITFQETVIQNGQIFILTQLIFLIQPARM